MEQDKESKSITVVVLMKFLESDIGNLILQDITTRALIKVLNAGKEKV